MAHRTTLTLDDDVIIRLKEEEASTGKSFRDLVNDLLRLGLMSSRRTVEEPRFTVRARALELRTDLGYDNIEELLEAGEGAHHR